MPKNTRVFRCVKALTKRYNKGAAIAICQKSTKQSYRTGKSLVKKRKKVKTSKLKKKNRRTNKKIKGGTPYSGITTSVYNNIIEQAYNETYELISNLDMPVSEFDKNKMISNRIAELIYNYKTKKYIKRISRLEKTMNRRFTNKTTLNTIPQQELQSRNNSCMKSCCTIAG